jgi:hypothetical protein
LACKLPRRVNFDQLFSIIRALSDIFCLIAMAGGRLAVMAVISNLTYHGGRDLRTTLRFPIGLIMTS